MRVGFVGKRARLDGIGAARYSCEMPLEPYDAVVTSLDNIGFHEAGITGISHENGTIWLHLENVHFGEESRYAVVALKGVRQIRRDGESVSEIAADHPDGEIIHFGLEASGAVMLIVEWMDYQPSRSCTRAYEIDCADLEIEKGAVDNPTNVR